MEANLRGSGRYEMDPKTALLLTFENYKRGKVSLEEVKKYGRQLAKVRARQDFGYVAKHQYAFS